METSHTNAQRMDASTSDWSLELLAVYSENASAFVQTARMLVGRHSEAEEIVHDAFLAAAAVSTDIENIQAYVRRSVVNGCYGQLRRRRIKERHVYDPPPPEAPKTLVEFRDVLLRLPMNQRAVIVLRFLDDCSVRETSEILNLKEATVRSHSARGLKKLRRELS